MAVAVISAVLGAVPAPASGQTGRAGQPRSAVAGESRESRLAAGWRALAGGRFAEASETARRLLKESPRDHDAASLAVAAGAAVSAAASLTAYEQWLAASRLEDPFLLDTVAVSFLRELSAPDSPVRYHALAALAAHGDRRARITIDELAGTGQLPLTVDATLAAAGNSASFEHLRARVEAQDPSDKSAAIDAVRASGRPGAAAIIRAALKDQAPPSRSAAAEALADLGASDAIPAIREALEAEQDPQARNAMRIALGRLGDPIGQEALEAARRSPVPSRRLEALEQDARVNPSGAWRHEAEALLQSQDPVARVRAAELLVRHGHRAQAEAVLQEALTSESAPLRTLAARAVAEGEGPKGDFPTLRRLLRDPLAEVRLSAARALLLR